VVLTDLFPTLLAIARIPLPPAVPCDGLNVLSLLRDPNQALHRDALFFHYPHYYHAPATTPVGAVRAWPWKLIEPFENQPLELYNLESDPGEQNEVSKSYPEKTSELQRELSRWRESVNAALPKPNPGFGR
jgi:arylsulfatase A-like enzyme